MMLLDRVRARLSVEGHEASLASVARALRHEGVVVGDVTALELVQALHDDLVGAGPLEALLHEVGVTDVVVNSPDAVYVDRGGGLEQAAVQFSCAEDVRRLAQRLASSVGRRLDDASPAVDARLPDGTRLHAVIPPIAVGCTLLSLRVPARKAMTLDELVSAGTVDEHGAELLRLLVASRASFLVSGGTGAGKTTILNSLLGLVDVRQRVVIVEDSTELDPLHPQTVRLQSRLPNADGAGTVVLRDLVRQSLRMRPDRIVVGEVRGPEVLDLLIALTTGHDGSAGTVHANSASEVPTRLEALGLLAQVDPRSIHALVASGLHAVVHVMRCADGRVVDGIAVVVADADGRTCAVPAWTRRDGHLREDVGVERWHRFTTGVSG
jgi:pilus assembly protein CpaF